jgi:hypothetical protein
MIAKSPYTLVLTEEERDAFGWVGYRYATGSDLASEIMDGSPEGDQWYEAGEITFTIPEHVAWNIVDLAKKEDNLWPCFNEELKAKMQAFVDKII